MIRFVFVFIAALFVFVWGSSAFVVDQTEQVIVTQFGETRRVIASPGLHFKLPWIQNVIFMDNRVLDLDAPSIEAITADQKRLVVDAFARYRIEDPLRYYQATGGVALRGSQQLSTLADAALRRVLGESTFMQVVKDDRSGLTAKIREQVDAEARGIGVAIVDIRLRRVDLPEQNSQAVFRRMQTERQREASELRAQGTEYSDKIKAQADRTVTVTKAEAERRAKESLGNGEADRARLLADAYGKDPDFFNFYRSMQAYDQSLRSHDTRFVITPESEFLRQMNATSGVNIPVQ